MTALPIKKSRGSYREQALSRVGETRRNNMGSLMTVDTYNNSSDVWVRFIETGNMVNTTWSSFLLGNVKSVYDKSKYGIGYIGEGEYKVSENGVFSQAYIVWSSMLARIFSHDLQKKQPTYIGCTLAEEWLNYQNFAEWFEDNYYEIEGHRTHLDKDILVKGNKHYSPETCVFVPQFINGLFLRRAAKRVENIPIGVRRSGKKFETLCNDNKGERIYLGVYNTVEEAFEVYKECKEKLIKDIAEEFKSQIPSKLFKAMFDYKVEITD